MNSLDFIKTHLPAMVSGHEVFNPIAGAHYATTNYCDPEGPFAGLGSRTVLPGIVPMEPGMKVFRLGGAPLAEPVEIDDLERLIGELQ